MKKLIKAAGDEKEDVLQDKIDTLRSYRYRFRTDPPITAFEQDIAYHQLIDSVYQAHRLFRNPNRFTKGLPAANPAETNPVVREAERAVEMSSIFLYRLMSDDFSDERLLALGQKRRDGELKLSPEENNALRQKHLKAAEDIMEDGYTARERRNIKLVDPDFDFKAHPKITHETAAFSNSLNPVQRSNNHLNKLELGKRHQTQARRTRTEIKKDVEGVMRGRRHWRVEHLFKACEVMDSFIAYVEANLETDRATLDKLATRYQLGGLPESNSTQLSRSPWAPLATAIVSADHLINGTDNYSPNPALALKVMTHFGLYEKAKKKSPHSKPLMINDFRAIYSGAI